MDHRGGIVGWIGYFYLRFNEKRALGFSIIVGIAGGLLGGALLAPMFSSVPVNSGDFDLLSLITAFATALACLNVADMVYKCFGV